MSRKPPGSVFKRCGCRRGKAGLRLGASCPRLPEDDHGSWFFSLELPRHERTGQRPAVAVWIPTQTAQFLEYISGHWLYAAFHLIALRGLRRGEAAGLRWCDIDPDHKVAYINWQIQYTGSALGLCPLKTEICRPDPVATF